MVAIFIIEVDFNLSDNIKINSFNMQNESTISIFFTVSSKFFRRYWIIVSDEIIIIDIYYYSYNTFYKLF